MNSKQREIISDFLNELENAKYLHPYWPEDIIHASAIINEEAGELIKATLNFIYEKGSKKDIIKEAVHVGATVIRFLESLS